jgi:histidinol dehydrogenase
MRIIDAAQYGDIRELTRRPVAKDLTLAATVSAIIDRVKSEGDQAVLEYAQRFDGCAPAHLSVSELERDARAACAPEALHQALSQAIASLTKFHRAQCAPEQSVETVPGVVCSRRSVAIERVGIYIPNGLAPLFSTLFMLAVPARVAGCKEIALATPGGKEGVLNPAIALCARLLGISEIYLMGGAQAIAALACGTESIKPVSKVCGPGNRYVTEAKLQLAAKGVAIDMPAGPSEVLIVADEAADPRYIAADLLAQAEHGPDSQVVLVACDRSIVERTLAEVDRQCAQLPRKGTAVAALTQSFALLVNSLDDALAFSNLYAPEHLILSVKDPQPLAAQVVNAGSVFLGYWAAEALGDYSSGTNHVLPTNGVAVAYSGVSVDTFVKKITFQSVSRAGLEALAETVTTMARAEGLEAHAQAIVVRQGADYVVR